jgi:hypothetical protein
VWTLRHPVHGQACHSLAGAWQEALERYARPCRLRALARERRGGTVRLLDVGTGLALNLAAARAELAGTGARLVSVTLEADVDVLEAAVTLPSSPPDPGCGLEQLRGALAERGRLGGGRIELSGAPGAAAASIELLLGDARETVASLPEEPAFDAVFLDPFSPGVEPQLWEPAFLAAVGTRMTPTAVLSSYTSAARVRRALAASGLQVGLGPRVGAKASGTLASPGRGLPPLGPREGRRARPRTEQSEGKAVDPPGA